ncbi:MAG: DUF4091 domain-containing protein [Odoribacter sp.]
MKKYWIAICWCCILTESLWAQESVFCQDFEELTDSKIVDLKEWELCRPLNSAWGSTDVRYCKMKIPKTDVKVRIWRGTVWRGERINAQVLLWGTKDCKEVSISVSDLKGPAGNVIPASAIRSSFVRYVMTDELNKDKRGTCGYRPDRTAFDSSMVADILDVKKMHNLQAFQTQPVWINIWTPSDVKAGIYRGEINFTGKGGKFAPLKIELKVCDRILPAPRNWKFWLDMWQNPYAVARYHQVPLWSEAHFDAMRPMMQQLANAGQKCITATLMHQPWGGQTEDFYESMVMRLKRLDGSWSFDYAVFDKWVEFMMSQGIDRQINCYTMIPWKLSFRYFDQASDEMKFLNAQVGTPEYRDYWFPFLVDFAKHLKEKKWFEITRIAMDERPMEQMQKTIALIYEADSAYKVALAGNFHSQIEKDIDDYSIASAQTYPKEVLADRRSKGMKSTFYTCCSEAYPNIFTFSPPAEAAWHSWYAAAADFDGFLRWAYNSWVKDPLRDSRFRAFGAGDCYQIYPGGRSSIRMERLVEGIQDAEKVRILKEEFKSNPDKLEQLHKILSIFHIERLIEESAADMVNKAREELNKL